MQASDWTEVAAGVENQIQNSLVHRYSIIDSEGKEETMPKYQMRIRNWQGAGVMYYLM